jgi:serine/threonine protein kinase
MSAGTQENVTYRSGFIKRPEHTTVAIRAGYSVICEIEGRPGVLLKVPLPFAEYDEAIEIEKRVYRRLGKHSNIVNVIDMNEWGIYLERAVPGSLRIYYKDGGNATAEERIRWCRDVAQVLDYVHQHNIRHADLSGKNLLSHGRNILLCDFGGSSVDDANATIIGEAGFRHFDENEYRQPTMRSEIHSLGSTIYEVIAGRKPFCSTQDQGREIEILMRQGRYPDVKTLPLGDVIVKCWNGFFDSALLVAEEISSSSKFHCYLKARC